MMYNLDFNKMMIFINNNQFTMILIKKNLIIFRFNQVINLLMKYLLFQIYKKQYYHII